MKTNKTTAFAKWLRIFLDEKGIDLEQTVEARGPSSVNSIPVGCLVDLMNSAPNHEQRGIKAMLVRIDFANAPVLPYFAHLAQAVAK